ncbi:hypothetical protein [Zoogloea sp.]|uniref:sensor histidine kinase n=1 Tax=Zoogloea sp. TaxID=49181 RepID=UPI001415D047|nr:MAG: HAMP domain-containing histidine kinase [Zoogloea sp.]
MVYLLPASVRIAQDSARDFRKAWGGSLGMGLLLLAALGVEGRQPMLLPLIWFVGMFLSGLHLIRAQQDVAAAESGRGDQNAYADAAVLLSTAWAIAVPLLAQEASASLWFLLAGALSGVAHFVRPLVLGEPLRLRICAGLLGLPLLILLLLAGTPLDYLLAAVVLLHVLMFVIPEAEPCNGYAVPAGLEQVKRDGRSRNDLMALAAGEMRPAINAILGVLQGCSPGEGLPQARCRDRLRVAARHLLGLVDAVADIARADPGVDADASAAACSLDVDRVALDEIVRHVIASHASGGATRLHVDMAQLPACLIGDGARITHALHSLVAQGLSPARRGRLTLEVRRARESRLGVLVEFRLGGCAVGLAPEQLAQLMKDTEPGGACEASGAFGAFGLRLLHLRHLAAQMGGEAGVLATEEGAVTVWFSAWLARQGEQGSPSVPMGVPAG